LLSINIIISISFGKTELGAEPFKRELDPEPVKIPKKSPGSQALLEGARVCKNP
jgi:hypothetical protein